MTVVWVQCARYCELWLQGVLYIHYVWLLPLLYGTHSYKVCKKKDSGDMIV